MFYTRKSYRLPSISFHDNGASHSRDTIWPWKFKVKGKGQRYPCWLISLVFHIRPSYRLPSLSFHDNRASHSQDTIWPWKFKVNCTSGSAESSWFIFLNVSHQGILSTPVPYVPWQSGLPFPICNLTLRIQCQRSRSKVKIKGTLVSMASSWLISFFYSHQLDQPFLRYGK